MTNFPIRLLASALLALALSAPAGAQMRSAAGGEVVVSRLPPGATELPVLDWLLWQVFHRQMQGFPAGANPVDVSATPGPLGNINFTVDQARTVRDLGAEYLSQLARLEADERKQIQQRYGGGELPPALLRALEETRRREAAGEPPPQLPAPSPQVLQRLAELRDGMHNGPSLEDAMDSDGLTWAFTERKELLAAAHQLQLIDMLGDAAFNALHAWIRDNVAGGIGVIRVPTPLPVRQVPPPGPQGRGR